ncbi:FtsX-like permease family protein [Sphingobacterium sp. SRCM116780]|uniref:ABC transporter permease n=1 Tax=Sphingobacterium sp. SRCM116780 TaxID=2907623 RepID=UPI001F1B7ED7|nr:ABC transporter permease [Sphingobacterium sp. SRCM116780]UIR55125.1 FtsX-like permease family protein [Sphingobacterium sp. SRCM116780]
MFQTDIKIAWRSLWKNKIFSLLNILGLMLGFSGFILSYQYINRETSYDKWNANFDRIYQIGFQNEGVFTNETPATLAPLLKESLPEIETAGRKVNYNFGAYPLFGEQTVYVKNAAMIDSSAAHIFQVESKTGALYKNKEQNEATLVKGHLAEKLFKKSDLNFDSPKSVPAMSLQLGQQENIYGISKPRNLSLIDYDLLFIKEPQDLFATGSPFLYQTYIQVKVGTDIDQLSQKINTLYRDKIASQGQIQSSSLAKGKIYLDPLANLHLRPKSGSNTPYLMIWIVGIISILILVLASANFANMMMAQADQRIKELALKRILGSSRWSIIRQLLLEVFVLTLIAALLSLMTLSITGNILQKWFNDDLKQYILSTATVLQLFIGVIATTILSGIYPAIILSGFKSINLLKGGLTPTRKKNSFGNGLLVFQISIALLFISGMFVIHGQIRYMQTTDKGFEPSQVISFKGIGMYYDGTLKGSYQNLKQRLENEPNILSVASATNIPGEGEIPSQKQFTYSQKQFNLEHIGIDKGYFKTLDIPTLQGDNRISIDQLLKDSLSHYAVINESTAKTLNLSQPIGTKLAGCGVSFEIIAVIKDSKAYGFENAVSPTIYSYKNECGPIRPQTTLMVKIAKGKVDQVIETVQKEWQKNSFAQSLPLDYSFMDQQYALLHQKQQELQKVFNSFTILSVIIAALGLFSMSAYLVVIRKKEMSVRKVLGASVQTIFFQLNKPFFKLFIVASLVSTPLAYLLLNRWLEHFAYRVEIQWAHFLFAFLIVFIIIVISISFQTIQAAKANPIDNLRDE